MHALTGTSRRGAVRLKLMATLFVAQVCGSTGHSIGLAVGAIMAASITGTNTWSGVPIAVGALGTALASWPLARLMDRAGRRPGLALGYGLAAAVSAGLQTETYRIPLIVKRATFSWAAGLTLVAALLSGWFVRLRLDRMSLIEVLKTRE